MIPSVASFTAVEQPLVSIAQPLACIPSFTVFFEETRNFSWNVEAFVEKTMEFQYYVGEGPLYWYRIDWYPSICPPNPCADFSPTIEYIAPNCPYEIIDHCIILPPDCICEIPCVPGSCISMSIEIWHMLATSVIHLCERINQECCHRKPPGYMRRVRKYLRPALCCDVDKICGVECPDVYEDVNFVICECGNLVDPCVAVIIYPCYVNRCAIHGPAFAGGPEPPISIIKMAPDLLGHMPVPIMQESVSAMPMAVQMVPPKEAKPVAKIVHKFGSTIPQLIHCNHNLSEVGILKDFLKSNKINFSSIELFYNKEYNAWHGVKSFKEWKIIIEWSPLQTSENEKNGYKLNISIDKDKKKTKISLSVKVDGFNNDKGNFEIDCNFNPSNGVLNSKRSVLQSKIIKDDIGLFKNGNLRLVLKG